LLAERARGDDPEPPVHALEVEHVRARQLPNLLLLPVLRKADAALLQSQFRQVQTLLWPKFTSKFHSAKRRFPITSKYRHMHGVLNVDEIKN
jgi:hypothetical protein